MKLRDFIGGNVSVDIAAPFFRLLRVFTELKGVTSQVNLIISVINLGLAF
jgi:hypothetical protein